MIRHRRFNKQESSSSRKSSDTDLLAAADKIGHVREQRRPSSTPPAPLHTPSSNSCHFYRFKSLHRYDRGMVNYGRSLTKCRRPGWESAYLDYDKLKRILGELEACLEDRKTSRILRSLSLASFDDGLPQDEGHGSPAAVGSGSGSGTVFDDDAVDIDIDGGAGGGDDGGGGGHPTGIADPDDAVSGGVDRIRDRFFQTLGREIEKMSLFTLQKQGVLADTVGAMRFEGDSEGAAHLFAKQGAIFQWYDRADGGAGPPVAKDDLYVYIVLGVELLYLLQFVAVNSIGIRKILKKYNKAVEKLDDPQYYHIMGSRDDVHLQQMADSQSIAAIQSSLQASLIQFYYKDGSIATDPGRALEYFRFQSVIQASFEIRRNAQIVNQPFNDFLSRKAMIFTGSNLGGIEGSAMRALDDLLTFVPSRMLTLDEATLDKMWSKWVPSYEQRRMLLESSGKPKEWSRLVDTTRNAMALLESEDTRHGLGHRQVGEKAWGGVNMISMVLNLVSILLYTINYYIVAPTANHYASILGTDGAFGATLIGASSFAALFAAFMYSLWYTRSSFKSALLFSTVCPLLGNLVYAMAISYQSMGMALSGRILCGFGSAEVVNRQLISTCVDFKQMTRASALFVAFGAMGMSIGPFMAAVLDNTAGRDLVVDLHLPFTPAGGIVYNHVTSPGFVMAALWFLEMLALLFFFQEPDRINGSGIAASDAEEDEEFEELTLSFSEEMTALVRKDYGSIKKGDSTDGEELSRTMPKASSNSGRSSGCCGEVISTWSLIVKNPGLPVTLILFCFIELADEVLISSCSMVVRRYFGWNGSAAGFLIASLGALVLPANFLVEVYSHRVSEKRIMKFSIWFIILSCIGILNFQGLYYDVLGVSQYGKVDPDTTDLKHLELYGEFVGHQVFTKENEFPYDWGLGRIVYIVFLSAIFMGTIILEGVDTSIMAQVTPAQLNDRFINSGLLATLVGTLGRVLSDSMITLSALLDIHVFVDFVIATFLPLLILAVGCLLLVLRFYDRLV